jgi:hypothetical protein
MSLAYRAGDEGDHRRRQSVLLRTGRSLLVDRFTVCHLKGADLHNVCLIAGGHPRVVDQHLCISLNSRLFRSRVRSKSVREQDTSDLILRRDCERRSSLENLPQRIEPKLVARRRPFLSGDDEPRGGGFDVQKCDHGVDARGGPTYASNPSIFRKASIVRADPVSRPFRFSVSFSF